MSVAVHRAIVVACQAVTLLVTWPLYGPSADGLVPSALPFGPILLGSLALALVRPAAGAISHAVVLGLAIAVDEMRLQPPVVSMAVVLVALAAPERAWLGRAHLGAQWAWAGIAKLVSPAFAVVVAPALARALPAALPFREEAPFAVAVAEVALGLAVLVPRAHRWIGPAAVILHAALLAGLVCLGQNEGAWAWNVALGAGALALFGRPEVSVTTPARRATGFALAAAPALFYLGLLHPALAHQLYAGTAPTTLTCGADGCRSDVELRTSLEAVSVPPPARVGFLRATFLLRCAPGDRWLARSRVPGAGYGAIVSEATCERVERSRDLVTAAGSGLNAVALSGYPGGHTTPGGVGWERP